MESGPPPFKSENAPEATITITNLFGPKPHTQSVIYINNLSLVQQLIQPSSPLPPAGGPRKTELPSLLVPHPWAAPPPLVELPDLPQDHQDLDSKVHDTEKITRELVFWVGHVNWCWRRHEEDAAAGAYPRVCKFQQCLDTKDLVQHATQCTAGNHCPVGHCALTNGIFRHYETCTFDSCWACQQLHRVPRCADRAPTTGNIPAVERPMPEAARSAHFEGTVADHKDQICSSGYQGSGQHAVIHEKPDLPKPLADQLVTEVYTLAPKFLQHSLADNFEVLCPPTDLCPNKCAVDKGKLAGQLHKLAWHRKGTKARLFCHDGKVKNVEAPVLRCRGCAARFLYSMWKNPANQSYQLYQKEQPYIKVTTKIFVDRMLMEDLINQMLISQTTFEGFAACKQRLHKWSSGFTRKHVSTAFFKHQVEKELRSRNMVDYKFLGQGKLLQCIPALIQLAFSSLLTHECSEACKAKNCELLFVLDGNWKIMFRHCAETVTNFVSEIPLINYPNVCTNGTSGNSEFCADHQQQQYGLSQQGCQLLLPGVTALLQAARNDIDRIMRSEAEEIQDRTCKEFNPAEICNKNKGEGQRSYHYSRGYMFIVRGTGHIEAFAPIYRAESLGQVFLFVVNWLYQYLQTVPEEKWDGIYLAYDNMCQLNRLRATKELLPLPPPYNSMWMRVHKIIDGLHIKNHKNPDCKRLYGPDKFNEQHGEAAVRNTMSAEQTFSWLTRYRKQTNSMTKDNQIFCLYQLSKERNLYISEQFKADSKILGSCVRSYKERD